jgi:hypothetical protein
MKHRAILLCLCGPLFIACNMLKNTRTSHDQLSSSHLEKLQLESHENRDWLSQSNSFTFQEHANTADYRVQFWPKGNFTYSAENGFAGQADSVWISGKSKANSTATSSLRSSEADKGKVKTQVRSTEKTILDASAKKKLTTPSWKVLLLGAGLSVLLFLFGVRKLTNKLNKL